MGVDDGPSLGGSAPADYAWLHVTTGPPGRHLELARQFRARGRNVAADPAQELHYRWDARQFRTLLARSEILFGNRSEIARAGRLLGVGAPARLLEWVPLVVRTEGTRGATAFTRDGRVHVGARRPRRITSLVGAGDAFRGGFYSAWFTGRSLEGCLDAGVRASTRWVEHPGG